MHQPADRLLHCSLDQDQVSDRDPVMRIHISRQRAQRPIGNPNCFRRQMLEGIRHGKKQYLHFYSPDDELLYPWWCRDSRSVSSVSANPMDGDAAPR